MSGAVEPAAAFFGFMGGSVGLILCCLGSAYGTAKAGVGLASVGVMRPQIVMKCIVPIIMCGSAPGCSSPSLISLVLGLLSSPSTV